MSKSKYIFITGGVVSSLGKGLASASLGALLQSQGYSVRLRKLDPYLNVDPGTMSPYQHGEVYVTDDGAETDLDLGHYERFTKVKSRKGDNVTAGKIYKNLLEKERKGDYLGGTVQVIPHVTDLIKQFILNETQDTDFILCEIGGTVGDIEALPFFESIRQLSYELGKENVIFVHLTLVPYLTAAKEIKTKPTQHSVKELLSIGIQPDILLCRSEKEIPESQLKKIALFSNIAENSVIPVQDAKTIYEVPLNLHERGLDRQVLKHFNMPYKEGPDLSKWHKLRDQDLTKYAKVVNIAIVGKYTGLEDAYKSLKEALHHAAMHNGVGVKVHWINARTFLKDGMASKKLQDMHGILVPGGFGTEGIKGKITAATFARENKIPYFGICLGMQVAVVELARNLADIEDATSSEFDEDGVNVVGIMTEWEKDGQLQKRQQGDNLGGTMRLGSYECKVKKDTLAYDIYGSENVRERHRHRYEVNINYKKPLEDAGVVFSGLSPDGNLPEIVELDRDVHPWFFCVQSHPEFKSRPLDPHPIFNSFVKAAISQLDSKK